MIKKFIKGAIVGFAALGMVGTASAADFEMNLNGASAQFTFWNAVIPAFLADQGCEGITTSGGNTDKISVGYTCDFTGENADTITIRYSSKNSSYGIGLPCEIEHYAEEAGCAGQPGYALMCDDAACGTMACKKVHVGASDVEMTSFVQQVDQPNTFTYNDFVACPSGGNQSAEFLAAGCPGKLTGIDKSVVVPFGFYASNHITKWSCTAPDPTGPNYEHYEYPHWGWQCDPSKNGVINGKGYQNADCQGYYKCFDGDGDGPRGKTCGGTAEQAGILGDACNNALDCQNDITETRCEQMPIDNLSRLMVLQIFSSENAAWLDRWNQFGPWYPDAGIVRCMRCAGSGTHATFDLQVFRGDATIMGTSVYGRFYHDESSSDLVKCIRDDGWASSFGPTPWAGYNIDGTDDVRYAVGYADADKSLSRTDLSNLHIVKYQGVEPVRPKIENNEYNFWAAQTLYWDPVEIDNAGLTNLLTALRAAANNAAFVDTLDPQSMFWTTQGAMSCQKVDASAQPDESAYPTVVPTSSPNYPNQYPVQ